MIGVSVIIPVYNVERYIEECIESVLANSYKDYEIICIDDGSTDNSLALVQELAKKHECIRVFSQKNAGQSAARNKALDIAQGKYVYFLDSDDKITTDALAGIYDKMEEEQLDVLYFSGETFYDTDELYEQFHEDFDDNYLRKATYGDCQDGYSILEQLKENGDYSVSPCIQAVRREFLNENEIRFVEGIIHEDNYFSFLVFVNAKRANCVNDVYFLRRIREDSVMTVQKSRRHLIGYYTCLEMTMKYLHTHMVPSEHEEIMNILIRSLRLNIQRTYLQLEVEERERFLEELTQEKRLLFRGVLLFDTEREVRARRKLKKIKQSLAYRVGRKVTWPIRMAKKVRRKLRSLLKSKTDLVEDYDETVIEPVDGENAEEAQALEKAMDNYEEERGQK